jgi:predicted amidophosphoribosyltransferase
LTTPGQCPTCRARFRGSRTCSRCGADLAPLMLLAARAWRLRQSARASLATSDYAGAIEAAAAAESLQATRGGALLRRLAVWLAEARQTA